MAKKEMIEKGVKVRELFLEVENFPPTLQKFFDLFSDELLDEKIEVLTALKEGKQISEIPNFYDILNYTQKMMNTGIETPSNRRCFSYLNKLSME